MDGVFLLLTLGRHVQRPGARTVVRQRPSNHRGTRRRIGPAPEDVSSDGGRSERVGRIHQRPLISFLSPRRRRSASRRAPVRLPTSALLRLGLSADNNAQIL